MGKYVWNKAQGCRVPFCKGLDVDGNSDLEWREEAEAPAKVEVKEPVVPKEKTPEEIEKEKQDAADARIKEENAKLAAEKKAAEKKPATPKKATDSKSAKAAKAKKE